MKEISIQIKSMVKEFIIMIMEISMMENLKWVLLMEKEYIILKMVQNMKENMQMM